MGWAALRNFVIYLQVLERREKKVGEGGEFIHFLLLSAVAKAPGDQELGN